MKKITYVLLVVVFLFGAFGCGKGEKESTVDPSPKGKTQPQSGGEATVDYSKVTLRVAAASIDNAHGLLEAAGLDDTPYKVEFTVMQGGNLVMEAMAAGQIDLGTGSQIPPIFASQAQNGGNFKVIAIRKANTLYQELIIPKGSSVKTVAELKGKKVGYVKNTTAHYFLAKMLKEAGLEWEDIEAVALTTSDGLTALLTNEIDALASYGNAVRTAKEKGATTLQSAADILTGDYYWYASPTAIEEEAYHAAITDYLRRYHESAEWARNHPEEWAEYLGPKTNQGKQECLSDFLEGVAQRKIEIEPVGEDTITSEQDIIDTFDSIGVLEKSFAAKTLFDHSFEEAISQFPAY